MEILSRLYTIDQRALLWCSSFSRQHNLYLAARIISKTGDGYLQVLLPLVIWFAVGQPANQFLLMVVTAFCLERTLYWVLKNSLKRRRPPAAIPWFQAVITASDEFSFPSGHTSGAFLLTVMAGIFLPALAIPLLIWATLVSCSRVVLGVHFPADVLAGATLGGSVGWIFAQYI